MSVACGLMRDPDSYAIRRTVSYVRRGPCRVGLAVATFRHLMWPDYMLKLWRGEAQSYSCCCYQGIGESICPRSVTNWWHGISTPSDSLSPSSNQSLDSLRRLSADFTGPPASYSCSDLREGGVWVVTRPISCSGLEVARYPLNLDQVQQYHKASDSLRKLHAKTAAMGSRNSRCDYISGSNRYK
jgi:hypothetical protein